MIKEVYRFRQFIDEMDKNTPSKNYSKNYESDNAFCKESWNDAMKLAQFGVKNQAAIEKIITGMALLESVKTKTFGMAEQGLCVDVGTYLTGEPECWISEQFEYKPKKVVKILVNVSHSCFWSASQIEYRGAGIISLIQMLKKQGYIVKANIYSGTRYIWEDYFYFLKIPSNPLDIQSLSYALCSTSLDRRFGFAFLEQKTGKSRCHAYGQAISLNEVALSKDIIHFKGCDGEQCRYRSETETKKYILNLFDEFLRLNQESRFDRGR